MSDIQGNDRGQAHFPNLEIGRGACRVLSEMSGELRGQAHLPNLEVGELTLRCWELSWELSWELTLRWELTQVVLGLSRRYAQPVSGWRRKSGTETDNAFYTD